jgi:hypothetical protein
MGGFTGLRVVLWVFLRGGINVGAAVLFDVARGGPVFVGFEARCAWSGRRNQRGARWDEHHGFALVVVC